MKFKVDMDKYDTLVKEESYIKDVIKTKQEELEHIKKEILNLFPKGYWWTSDIDYTWKRPKKYSIKEVYNGYVVVKEVFKKAPWEGFDGRSTVLFKDLFELNVYKTEEEAKKAVYNRICPNCGGVMKYTIKPWCDKCIEDRWNKKLEYERTHVFYEPNEKLYYTMGYTDELTRDKGFGGKHFIFQRLDTGEIIESDNLWSSCSHRGDANVPEIKFLTT